MRVRRIIARAVSLLVCAFFCGLTPTSAAPSGPLGWQALGGPIGRITALTANPRDHTQIYAVSDGRALYRSRDGGATWHPATNNLPPGQITVVYADPVGPELYAVVESTGQDPAGGSGLWISRDEGATWERVRVDSAEFAVRSVARTADGSYLVLLLVPRSGDGNSFVYRSSDNGNTWQQFEVKDTGQTGNVLLDLVADPGANNRLFATSARGQVYRSNDSGQTWDIVANEDGAAESSRSIKLAVSPDQPDTIFLARGSASDQPEELLFDRSADGGRTWRRMAASGLPRQGAAAALLAVSTNALLLNTGAGTYRTTDGGTTWRLLEGSLSGGGASAFISAPGSRTDTLAATGNGVFLSRDSGALWQPISSGLPGNSRLVALATDPEQPGQLYALDSLGDVAASTGPSALMSSQDGGQTWKPVWPGMPALHPAAWALGLRAPQVFYVATADQLLVSQDRGLSWKASRPEVKPSAMAAAPSDPTVVYMAGSRGEASSPALMRSTDSGSTWQEMALLQAPGAQGATAISGLAVDPADSSHAWAALPGKGIYERTGSGAWQNVGLSEKPLMWLAYATEGQAALYAGIAGDGIYRQAITGTTSLAWTPISSGLPEKSTVVAFVPDERAEGMLWSATGTGGVYRSTDYGASWTDVSQGIGDNRALALAIDYATPGGIFAAMEDAGVWALRPNARPSLPPQAVDARIEIVWPHDGQPVSSARQANIGLRLLLPGSLVPPPCTWAPKVTVWQAVDTNPAIVLGSARQRNVDGRAYPYWELNDVDVRVANDPSHKVYYMVQVLGTAASTSVWAHGSDARTYFPEQDVPSGIATDALDALDARIQIVWPHDAEGNQQPVETAGYANVAVALFKRGTRLSVPVDWQPPGLTLYGAWNQHIGQALTRTAVREVRQSGAIKYPVWEFQNVPVSLASDPANKLFLWVMVDGVPTYPTLWTHGADGRTYFPAADEPIQRCAP